MKKLAIGLLLSMVSVSAFANTPTFKTLADEKATFELCESMAKAINTETMDFKLLHKIVQPYYGNYETINPALSLDVATHNNEQLARNGLPLWGKPIETLFVKTDKDKLGYFVRHNFMLRRENNALSFYCDFYKSSNNQWKLSSFIWTDLYTTFFE